MSLRLCLFSASFNPPGKHHTQIAVELARVFEQVRIIPTGYRPDKSSNNAVAPTLRAALVDLAFERLPGVVVDHFDLEQAWFTRTSELDSLFEPAGEVWHAVSAELCRGGSAGESFIQRKWQHGRELWNKIRWAVYAPADCNVSNSDLPPRHMLVTVPELGSSREIRRKLFDGEPCRELLDPAVWEYIHRYGIYQLSQPQSEALVGTAGKRLMIVADPGNAKALEWQERLASLSTQTNPDFILVLGGDGTMLGAIRQHWQMRRPFIGLNAGHLGFLMNEGSELIGADGSLLQQLTVRRLPMLRVDLRQRDGTIVEDLSFNDAWIERSTGQTAWLKVSMNGDVKLEKVVCDGLLVSTAAGSTAYAMSMGASPLLADTPAWLLVGSNVMRPLGWKSAVLPLDASIHIEGLSTEKRTLNGYVGGRLVPDVVEMTSHISRVATVELAFSPRHDMARKISDLQFGLVRGI